MICYKCNHEAGKEKICPLCGADLSVFQKVIRLSNVYYNDGLQKAEVRNLSGAIISLKKSLKFNKYNIENNSLKLYLATKDNYNSFEEYDFIFIKDLIDKFFANQIISIRSIVEGSVLSFCLVSEESDMVIKLTNMVNYNNHKSDFKKSTTKNRCS